ncbi:FadR/GntR family transcriptional regulator [Bacillus benzoevorans]|uniref:GntR family transcriptional repressor for pyruvate dehydrogenase complex n=1 Tax=Bacillus benzoevorans TaxID=1456 RepID=A0A7X0HTL6_9BACI|nr:FadR/GntR family transcriptional regulator [Bacillus benzoevorans]MBB6446566.1 GntR family transcriptional repressor for pyruvate dehydrogenase complex [Bacillus benzoevorans]
MKLINKKLLTLSEQIAEQIRAAIISRDLSPGDKLPPEQDLAEQFQVSRPTIRDAIKLLTAAKLIVTKSGAKGGHFVAEIDLNALMNDISDYISLSLSLEGMTIDEVLEVRETVELKSCSLAALRRREEDLQVLKDTLAGMDAAISSKHFYERDFLFHKAIAKATHNRMVITTIEAIILSLTRYFNHTDCPIELRDQLTRQAYDIYEAIEQQKPELAAKKMEQHLNLFTDFLPSISS